MPLQRAPQVGLGQPPEEAGGKPVSQKLKDKDTLCVCVTTYRQHLIYESYSHDSDHSIYVILVTKIR